VTLSLIGSHLWRHRQLIREPAVPSIYSLRWLVPTTLHGLNQCRLWSVDISRTFLPAFLPPPTAGTSAGPAAERLII